MRSGRLQAVGGGAIARDKAAERREIAGPRCEERPRPQWTVRGFTGGTGVEPWSAP